MTLGELIDKVRSRSRDSVDFFANSKVQDLINEALDQFSTDVHGLKKETYLALSPLFDTATHFAIRLTIEGGANALAATDVAVTSTARTNAGGATVAADLQTAVRAAGAATATVTWSTTEWVFTIDAVDSDSITVEAPEGIVYADATALLFGTSGSQSGTSWEGSIPQDANLEVALPDDFQELVEAPYWNGQPLFPAPFDLFVHPQAAGDPLYYHVLPDLKKLRIYPVPTSQEIFHLWYRYLPTYFGTVAAYQECGLTGKTDATATGLAGATQYYFKVTIDTGDETEYDITTGGDTTFAAVIALMNAELDGAAFSLEDGDLRCTSEETGADSLIELAAGSTGTDLFATLTDFDEFEDPYSELDVECDQLPREYQMALVFYAAGQRCESNDEDDKAAGYLGQYSVKATRYRNRRAAQNPKYRQQPTGPRYRPPRVVI